MGRDNINSRNANSAESHNKHDKDKDESGDPDSESDVGPNEGLFSVDDTMTNEKT